MRFHGWLVLLSVLLIPQQTFAENGRWLFHHPQWRKTPATEWPCCPWPLQPIPSITDPSVTPTPTPTPTPTLTPTPTPTDPTTPTDTTPQGPSAFGQAPPAGSASYQSFAPDMFGSATGLIELPVVIFQQFPPELPPGGGNGDGVTPIPPDTSIPPSPQPKLIIAVLNNPSGGGKVGRIVVAEDINPLPRDRFIFNYDHFHNVPLTQGGWNVDRFVLGFEKTFFNQNTSVEFRVPFAGTLDSDTVMGAEATNTEFGNLRVLLKGLLYGNDTFNVCAGLGLSFPTAPTSRVISQEGTTLAEIRNETVILMPYVGLLYTPSSRFFAQTWMAFDFDPRGNPTYVNPTGRQLEFAGRMTEQTIMQFDGQIGYWVYRSPNSSGLTGLAPFLELHYHTRVTDADIIKSDNFIIGDTRGRRDDLTLTAGLAMLLGNNFNLSIASVVPLRGESDRTFDFQLGVRATLLFGPSARQNNPAYFVP